MTETTTKRWMLLGISGVLTFVPIAFAFMHMIGSDVALIFQTLLFVDAATVLIAGRYYQRRQMHQ